MRDCVSHAVCDSNGHVWANSHEHPVNQLIEFDRDGNLLRRIAMGEEFLPGEMVVDTRGYIYCNLKPDPGFLAFVPPQESVIAQYGLDFRRIRTIGKTGSGIGELRGNNGMALDESGRLYVADTGNSRIQVFDSSGQSLGVWYGPADKRLDHPLGVAMGPNQTLWVTDTYNNRIVREPLAEFWKQVSVTVLEPVRQIQMSAPAPAAGRTAVTGIVIAGTDDFADDIYVESADRAWGVCVTLPKGAVLKRGETCRLTGVLSKDRFRLSAKTVEVAGQPQTVAPYGMANLYVGDGYRSSSEKKEISNLCLLVRTWGRVASVDKTKNVLVIDDGSYSGGAAGLAVYFGSIRKPVDALPKPGQYVAVTGVSTTWVDAQGRHVPAVRIRNAKDVQVLSGE